MKIIFITEYFPASEKIGVRGGVEARCYFVARELSKVHDIAVITSREQGTRRYDFFSGIKVTRCGAERKYSQGGSVFKRLSFMWNAYRIALAMNADIIEGENFIAYLPAYFAARKKGVPAVAMYADVLIGDWIPSFGIFWGTIWEGIERFILAQRWDRFIAISKTTEKKLIREGIKQDRIRTVYCPVDLAEYQAEAKKFRRPTVISIARLVKYKRIDLILRAISILRKRFPDIELKIIGTGPELDSLNKLADELGITDNVDIIGYVEDRKEMLRMLKMSHIFCLPSSVEGFGIVTIEAMASGIPYVNSDIPVTKEITDNGMGGLLFKNGDYRDLAKKIEDLLQDKTLYRKKATEGRKHVQKYSIEAISKQLEEIYESMK